MGDLVARDAAFVTAWTADATGFDAALIRLYASSPRVLTAPQITARLGVLQDAGAVVHHEDGTWKLSPGPEI